MHALVISRIDSCNSLLNGLSITVVNELERVQNASARVILIRSKRDHAMPLLLELDWLPVRSRITFKTLHSRPYFSPLNASIVLHLHIYQHSSLRIARHVVYALLISYILNSPLPELQSANDPSLVQLQTDGTNHPLQCANIRVLISLGLHSRQITDYFNNRRSHLISQLFIHLL